MPPAAHPLRVLIADDSAVDAALLRAVCACEHFAVTVVSDGVAALDAFRAHGADLVMLDAEMPRLDGFETTRRLRRMLGPRWLPIVIVSGLNASNDIVHGLEAGADDFICKPIDQQVLRAKLRVLGRASLEQVAVDRFRDWKASETELASAVLDNIVRSLPNDDPEVRRLACSASDFSGDLVLTARTSHGCSYVLVADAVGHGLAATICILPLVRIFSTMTAKALPLGDIAAEMNRHLHDLLPTGYYVAADLVAIDRAAASVTLWNGGMPPALLLGDGDIRASHASHHLPLGISDDDGFDGRCRSLAWQPGTRLFLHSDGVNEACADSGERFGYTRMHEILRTAPRGGELDALLDGLTAFTGATELQDDVTAVVIDIP